MKQLLKSTTRNLFFTGKGGVGKTSIATAVAIGLADAGQRVLLVSTDPASNLDELLGTTLACEPRPIAEVPQLSALNLDPERAAQQYRQRVVEPYRELLPADAVQRIEEQLSGSCTMEVAAFDQFTQLLAGARVADRYDRVVFDTAPTGHTLRLLSLPSAWTDFISTNTTGTSCLGPLAGLQAQQQLYQRTVDLLGDPAQTTLILVARPLASALQEADRAGRELSELGLRNQQLVVNGIFHAAQVEDPYARALQQQADAALQQMPERLAELPRVDIAWTPEPLSGPAALRRFLAGAGAAATGSQPTTPAITQLAKFPALMPSDDLLDALAEMQQGVIFAMGKGGVGKTTIAAAVACALAERGANVQLTTTDPAAHLEATVAGDHLPQLSVCRIDPAAEVARYSQEVLVGAGAELDAEGHALLAEDLRSPCTEETAVFRAFAETVDVGRRQLVVLDTAPTGHTILLLDAAMNYHREVQRQAAHMPESVRELLRRLRDPETTRVLIVTLPERTPVQEAAGLQRDLRRAGIDPYAWVVNQSFLPLDVGDPLLVRRQDAEVAFVREVMQLAGQRATLIPWQSAPPVGRAALKQLWQVPVR